MKLPPGVAAPGPVRVMRVVGLDQLKSLCSPQERRQVLPSQHPPLLNLGLEKSSELPLLILGTVPAGK